MPAKLVVPGVLVAAAACLAGFAIHLAVPVVPMLTAAVALGIVAGQIPAVDHLLRGPLAPGLALAARRFMRLGVVLLGLKLSLGDILELGWLTIVAVIAVLLITFVVTLGLGQLFRLPGHQPLLIATGSSICGASAIGAMAGVIKSKDEETATPIALVTLCGTLAIGVLPLLWHPLGLDAIEFGFWAGAGVHDVGQVVATAQIAGSAALAVAVVVKLTRVLMLAPMVAIAGGVMRRRASPEAGATRPAIFPLFVAGFVAAVAVSTLVDIPAPVLEVADGVQTALLGMALFGLGTAVRFRRLVRTGWRALIVALLSWTIIATLAYGAIVIR